MQFSTPVVILLDTCVNFIHPLKSSKHQLMKSHLYLFALDIWYLIQWHLLNLRTILNLQILFGTLFLKHFDDLKSHLIQKTSTWSSNSPLNRISPLLFGQASSWLLIVFVIVLSLYLPVKMFLLRSRQTDPGQMWMELQNRPNTQFWLFLFWGNVPCAPRLHGTFICASNEQ